MCFIVLSLIYADLVLKFVFVPSCLNFVRESWIPIFTGIMKNIECSDTISIALNSNRRGIRKKAVARP